MKFTAYLAAAGSLACASLAVATPASAQTMVASPNPASARLGQCLVGNTTGNDRVLVARWMAASMASSPMMQGLVSVDQAEKERVDRLMADLFTRLMAKDCLAEAKVVMQARDQQGMQAAGGRLGEIAMQELMMDPAAMAALLAYVKHIDPADLAELGK